MGRTNPTFRDTLRRFRERWQPYRRALRRQFQGHFDSLIEQGARFADAGGFQNPADSTNAVFLSMLLGHEVDLQELEERVDELETQLDEEG